MNTHLFGAASGIGRWFTERVLKNMSDVWAYDLDPKILKIYEGQDRITGVHLSKENAIKGDFLIPHAANINSGDTVLIAVPEEALKELIELLSVHLPDSCRVGVMTSVQEKPIEFTSKTLPQSLVFGLHPLFGPAVDTPHGQLLALCLDSQDSSELDGIKSLFEKQGLLISELTPKQHDLYMGYVQALTHFVLLAYAKLLSDSETKLLDLMKVRTPPFQFLTAFASRLLIGNPATYAAIQNTDTAQKIREMFIESTKEIHEVFQKVGIEDGIEAITSIREPFSGSTLDEFSQFSLISVSAVQERERSFHSAAESKSIVVFRSRESEEFRVGRIEKIGPAYLTISELTTRIKLKDGTELIPCPFNKNAIETYRKSGTNIQMSKPFSVKKGKISLMPKTEAKAWLLERVLLINKVITFPNPMNLNEDTFEEWIPSFIDGVIKCRFMESHKQRGELPRVMLRLRLHPAIPLKTIEKSIRAFCYGYGPEKIDKQ